MIFECFLLTSVLQILFLVSAFKLGYLWREFYIGELKFNRRAEGNTALRNWILPDGFQYIRLSSFYKNCSFPQYLEFRSVCFDIGNWPLTKHILEAVSSFFLYISSKNRRYNKGQSPVGESSMGMALVSTLSQKYLHFSWTTQKIVWKVIEFCLTWHYMQIKPI